MRYKSVIFDAKDEMSVYSMDYEDVPERAHWGAGRRNYCILHYVTHGNGWFCGRAVRGGQGFYIHSGQMHEYHADKKEGWNYFWMIFSEGLAKKYVLPHIPIDENGIFSADFIGRLKLERARIFAVKKPMSSMQALSAFFSVLALHEGQAAISGSLPLAHIAGAKLFIENNMGRRLTVREVAQELCIDDRYLYNLFRKYEGMSVKAYIDRCRTDYARALMEQENLSISEIAHRMYFEDVCTFSKFFRAHTGISPSGYRRRSDAHKTAP